MITTTMLKQADELINEVAGDVLPTVHVVANQHLPEVDAVRFRIMYLVEAEISVTLEALERLGEPEARHSVTSTAEQAAAALRAQVERHLGVGFGALTPAQEEALATVRSAFQAAGLTDSAIVVPKLLREVFTR